MLSANIIRLARKHTLNEMGVDGDLVRFFLCLRSYEPSFTANMCKHSELARIIFHSHLWANEPLQRCFMVFTSRSSGDFERFCDPQSLFCRSHQDNSDIRATASTLFASYETIVCGEIDVRSSNEDILLLVAFFLEATSIYKESCCLIHDDALQFIQEYIDDSKEEHASSQCRSSSWSIATDDHEWLNWIWLSCGIANSLRTLQRNRDCSRSIDPSIILAATHFSYRSNHREVGLVPINMDLLMDHAEGAVELLRRGELRHRFFADIVTGDLAWMIANEPQIVSDALFLYHVTVRCFVRQLPQSKTVIKTLEKARIKLLTSSSNAGSSSTTRAFLSAPKAVFISAAATRFPDEYCALRQLSNAAQLGIKIAVGFELMYDQDFRGFRAWHNLHSAKLRSRSHAPSLQWKYPETLESDQLDLASEDASSSNSDEDHEHAGNGTIPTRVKDSSIHFGVLDDLVAQTCLETAHEDPDDPTESTARELVLNHADLLGMDSRVPKKQPKWKRRRRAL